MELRELFGTSLRQCRRARRLTQAQLAEAIDLSLEMIGRLERGLTAPSFETIASLVEALQIAPVELFGGEPSAVTGERREVLDRYCLCIANNDYLNTTPARAHGSRISNRRWASVG